MTDSTNQLVINSTTISYNGKAAVKRLSLTLKKGEIGCLLGPSGCGKTTLQRSIAGFEPVTDGHIRLAGKTVAQKGAITSPEKRSVGMVFQDFALFPHLTVERNIAFGLQGGTKKNQRYVDELLSLVNLNAFAKHYPNQLSGGQQQRVALARALAPKPDILLLDEPFSSLDTQLREQLARDIRKILKDHDMTALMVTHDQKEAFAFADKIGVMNQGELQQWDTPYAVYHNPASLFVAEFIGEGTTISAKVNQDGGLYCGLGEIETNNTWPKEQCFQILVRPDDLIFNETSEKKFPIISKEFRGSDNLYNLQLPTGETVQCDTPSHIDYNIGSRLPVITDLQHLVIFRC